ncbi:phage tail tip lysozyme [Cupriavidus campinensis]|uniref:Phage tail tip lysozyme n=1 Tax=Cupriavidus campinensis TaxID=151783 RepID=A0AAE9L103_9BURK|nr:phage tail tip lysozyme [Cupriavidus campinensis]URF02789.1 phage tail tip lysozyme [Cupriavidus campinensis]
MANTFKITIAAVDKATATVRRVNQSMARLTSPVRDLKQSLGGLGRELGLNKVNQSLGSVAKSARGAVSGVTALVPALGAITGAATIAGIAALANNWGKLGAEIDKTSSILGVSTKELQQYQAAAKLAGLSAEDMNGSLKSLGDTLEDAAYNRNSQALILMNQLGISLTRTKTGAVDATRALRQVAEAIARQGGNVQAQRLIARTFGVEQLLPMLQKGAAGIEQYVAQARALGSVMGDEQIQAAKDYAQNVAKLDLAIDGLKASIGNALIPVLSPLLAQLSEWVTKNRDLIATKVGDFVKGIADWVKSVDWGKVARSVGSFVDALGGVKGVAIALAAITFAGPIAGVISLIGQVTKLAALLTPLAANPIVLGILGITYSKGLNKGEDEELARRRGMAPSIDVGPVPGVQSGNGGATDPVAFFQSRGWSKEQAAGIVANLQAESGLRPDAVGDSGKAYGVAQWHPDRQRNFRNWSGKDIRSSTLEDQLAFVHHELTAGLERAAGDRLKQAKSAGEAGEVVSRYYERPADADGEASRRALAANQLSGGAPMAPVYASGGSGARPQGNAAAGSAAGGAVGGKVLVEVVLAGATQGVRANVRSSGNVEATTRVRTSMLTEGVS